MPMGVLPSSLSKAALGRVAKPTTRPRAERRMPRMAARMPISRGAALVVYLGQADLYLSSEGLHRKSEVDGDELVAKSTPRPHPIGIPGTWRRPADLAAREL